jgi:hypothetical protein
MPTMVSVARIDPSKESGNGKTLHNRAFGQYATMVSLLRDPTDPSRIAAIFDVHDLEGLRTASRTPEGDAAMREMGFVEQLGFYLEA